VREKGWRALGCLTRCIAPRAGRLIHGHIESCGCRYR
jgi:hypothetical protein